MKSVLSFIFFFLFCLFTSHSYSQHACYDSLRKKLQNDSLRIYRLKKFLPYISIDNRTTFINKSRFNMSGFKMGVVYRESEIFGIGLYSVLGHGGELKNPKDASDTLKIQIKMEYLTLFYHHIVFKKRFLEFQLPFELGLGSSHFTFLSKKNSGVTKEKHIPVVPYGLGMKFIFKPVPHAGIFLYLGYLSTLKSYKYPVPLKGLFSSLGLYVNILKINRDTRYYLFKKKRFRRDVKKCVVK